MPVTWWLVWVGLLAVQDAPAVFTATTDVITKQITFVPRNSRCPTGLAADDWRVVAGRKAPASLKVEEAPDRPCTYLLSFTPPALFRDGKQHELKVRVRVDGRWRTLSFKWKVEIPQSLPSN